MKIELLLKEIIPYIIGILEAIGVFVVIVASCKAFIKLIKYRFDVTREDLKIEFSMGLALALEFKLGAEILKTVTVRSLDEFFVVAAVTVLRMLISFMIHWEVRTKEKENSKVKMENEKNNNEYI
ncbi:MAG TPA: DUF1622 domain-containing protein [Tissierellaceae bacterium]